ncbi:MAG TPA: hypothetical protein DEG17_14195 [Cyanobacteria bacterium UBA11149]|nr:hypothetical protein [Cyanobacteria bacterium UBA11367]HBE60779.1 hypothetical protein [Cyanobacteria bacterium UBA11366]HBK63839.1 hypothetical protein [Cyanobacteria bacterium UBA11166]HBR75386.1 hypothetical protein [Cyanobacteria bacterium UBA11159]HBS69922.1 hypothetical protein [Cyanobacteria bacterium UBA11153]HBW89989.1 hypothetical protein [Cyanobacteria bacterium UBA11149]HCA95697.1 hypothetical protein [Cyanobacteria bacterium UBA9226]
MISMLLVFLVGAIGSIYLSLKAVHEVSRILAISSAIFCSIFSFALAPWPIQILIFIVLLGLEGFYPFRKTALEFVTLSVTRKW